MRIQNIVFPEKIDEKKELFYRGELNLQNKKIDKMVRFDTYMNFFDAGTWKRYTGIDKWKFSFKASGKGRIELYRFFEGTRTVSAYKDIDTKEEVITELFFAEYENALYYIQINAEESFILKEGYFSAETVCKRNICIGVVICTYHREKQILSNLEKLKTSHFFQPETEYYGKLQICIVDNAKSLSVTNEPLVMIYHNANEGGSGGFSKGMKYMCQNEKKFGLTDVLLMDDDVEFYLESFYRLYALLMLRKPEMMNRVVAGRMFRNDEKYIQYTKTEIWNRSEILHTGFMQDMRLFENLILTNIDEGEYSGWWFACFSMKFVQAEKPLPFFLHCDDVEYGLRIGTTPMALNGIQVWHETYEYRKSSVTLYYDVRNSLITNAVRGCSIGRRDLWKLWKKRLNSYLEQNEIENYYAVILGLFDFSKGGKWFFNINLEKHHCRLKNRITGLNTYKSQIYLIITYLKLMIYYKKIQKGYCEYAQNYFFLRKEM